MLGGTDVLLDVRPLGATTLLVTQDALAELSQTRAVAR